MLPIISKPPITPGQKKAALAVTIVVDLIQIAALPAIFEGALSPLQDGLDFITALVLIAICGFKWQFVVAFIVELFPVVDIFPTWTALVLTLPTAATTSAAPVPPVQASASAPRPQARAIEEKNIVDVEAMAVPPVQRPPLPNQ